MSRPGPNVDPRRCQKEGCSGWALLSNGKKWCVAHDPHAVAVANAGRRLAREGLNLPKLDSVDAAKVWLRKIGEAVAEGRLKPSLASELRRIAVAYCDVDPATSLADKLEHLEGQIRDVQQKQGETEPWHE